MAVFSPNTVVIYSGNNLPGVPYPVPFRVDDAADIFVGTRPDSGVSGESPFAKLPPSGYVVTLIEETGTAEVVTTAVYSPGTEVGIWREVPITQTREYTVSGPFPAKSHEAALDKLTMLVQQVDAELANTLKIRTNDGQVGDNYLPPPKPGVVGYDSFYAATIFSFADLATAVRPRFMEVTLSAVNPTTLDIPAGLARMWVNTTEPIATKVRLWVNYAGSLFNVILNDAGPPPP